MTIGASMIPEFDAEMANTRKVLERVPENKFNWQVHEKSNTIGWLANHLADIPAWVEITLQHDVYDIHPPGGKHYKNPEFKKLSDVLATFDRNVASARDLIAQASDAQLLAEWTMLSGGEKILSMPKVACLRTWVLNHTIHHRAIMTVYLRLNHIPVPALYGPSADESM